MSALSALTFVLGCICFVRDESHLKETIDAQPLQTSFKYLAWTVLKVYHPLLSGIVPLVNPILGVPRLFNLLSLLIYIFAVVLSSLVYMVGIASD